MKALAKELFDAMTTTQLAAPRLHFPARVVGIQAASQFVDDKARVTLKIEGADVPWNQITFAIPDADDYQLEQEMSIVIQRSAMP